ncbi:MAG TPA: GH1 family beta-glucosidase [Bryobacteraceae bacterium]|jgi:beta-glucosidase|nr:GH1 family beta-glucosidase [Bryobacteraceae bacterium]
MSFVKLSRRHFGKTIGAAAAGSAATQKLLYPPVASAQARPDFYGFPNTFRWGCATAAYQVEGGAKEGGRGPSIWDKFSHTPGKVYEDQTGDVADDDYHRFKEDVALLKDWGAKIYRFSVSWSRIFPNGTGSPNEAGINFYERVVDDILANGIDPFCTLFHWDLLQVLQDRLGGWQSRETSKAFADYAGYFAGRLSDRVHHFFTMNEFSSFIDLGYRDGRFAPGLRLAPAALNQTRHNAVLAHGMAVQAIRAKARSGTKVGLAENYVTGTPIIESKEHVKASVLATRVINAPYLTVILEGNYMEQYLQKQGASAPKFTPEDLKIISSPLDLVGINIYNPTYIRASEDADGYAVVPLPSSYPHMASPWLNIGPEGLYWGVRHLTEIWNVKDIYVTENGCSSADVVTADGQIYDTDRVMFLRNYLINLHRAAAEGFPVHGYFLWSLLDNFEWADGYNLRFGIYYVDYKTQKRIPKMSAHFYREVIRRNAVV